MKKINMLVAAFLLFGLSGTAVLADTLNSNKALIGSWFLEYSKKSLDATETKPMGMTWVINDTQLIQKDIPQVRGNAYDAPAVDYILEDGNLKVSILGRAGKFDVYSLEETSDKTMILKDNKYGAYLYFVKK